KQTLLAHEREMLGLYVSDHPLLGLEHVLANTADCTVGQLLDSSDKADGASVTIAGLVTSVQRKVTRNGDSWAMVTVEDLEGAIEVLLFPSTYQLAAPLLVEDTVVRVRGVVNRGKEQPELHAREVTAPDLSGGGAGPVQIALPLTRCTPPVVDQLKEILGTHPGVTEVRLKLLSRGSTKVLRLDDRLRVATSPALFADLKQLLGPGCLG
nr:OB-fold nucleic acid binding domain-containing protein [Actinomycetota bacterium]